MGDLYLLRGLPNAGKSTIAEQLAPGAVFAADDLFETDAGYVFDRARLGEAHSSCRANVRKAFASGVERIAVANTFATRDEITPYLEMAHLHDYHIHVMAVEKLHDGDNEHDVPLASVKMMTKRFEWIDPRLRHRRRFLLF